MPPTRHTPFRAGAAVLVALATLGPLAACGSDAPQAAASDTQWGLVVIPEDPAHHGVLPEDLEAQGIRPYYHDFGRVPVGETIQHVFQLENTDPQPVTITRMQASCGCTKPSIRYVDADGREVKGTSGRDGKVLVVPPGEVAELSFRIDTKKTQPLSHNTGKLYTVTMVTDSPNRAHLRLETHVLVENAFQVTPNPIDLGRVPASAGGEATTDIIQLAGIGARIVGVGPLPGGVEAEVVEQEVLGRPVWTLQVSLVPPMDKGPVQHEIELMTEDPEGLPYFPLPIEVRAYAVDDIEWSPIRFVLRGAAEGDGAPESVLTLYSLLSGEDLKITAARLEGQGTDGLELTYRALAPDTRGRSKRWELTLRPRPSFGDAIVRGEAVIELEGHDPVRIDVIANPN